MAKISQFNIADHLDSEEVIRAYLDAAAESDDPAVIESAKIDAEKARARIREAASRPAE
jgi:DNA-binding phage protein